MLFKGTFIGKVYKAVAKGGTFIYLNGFWCNFKKKATVSTLHFHLQCLY